MSEAIGESQLLIKTPDHQQLFVKQNRPLAPQAVLVVVHGLGGHQGRYDYLTNWFVAHYVAVYRYDHRGHGQTPGAHGVYGDFNHFPDDLKTVVDWAKKKYAASANLCRWSQSGRRYGDGIWCQISSNGQWHYFRWGLNEIS